MLAMRNNMNKGGNRRLIFIIPMVLLTLAIAPVHGLAQPKDV